MALLGRCEMHDFESAIGCKRTLTRARRAEQRQRIPPKSIACRRHTLTLLRAAHCHAVAPPFRGVYHRARIRATRWLLQVICPSGALSTGVSSLISDFPKNISVPTYPKSILKFLPSHPTRGAYHDRHGRGEGCGGRGSVLRATGLQGGLAKGL
jgi:hypothetical protein